MSAVAGINNPTPEGTAPTVTKPKAAAKGGRMLELDGYRGLAAIMIVIVHAWMQGGLPYPHTAFETLVRGFGVAVSLFFALSGLVSFMPLVRGALSGRIPSGKEFLARRLYRILPLYFFLIIAVWASRYAGTSADWSTLLTHLTFTQVYDKHHLFWIDGPAWSLADEMHFYILITLVGPPLARFAAKRATVGARLAVMATLPAILLTASIAYTAIAYYVIGTPLSSSWTYYNPLARVDTFAMGMLLAVAVSAPGVLKARPKLAVALTTLGLAGLMAFFIERSHYAFLDVFYFTIAGLPSMLLLLGATMFAENQLFGKFLRSKWPQLWGTVGFSLYLWHEPLMLQLTKWHILYFVDAKWWPISALALIVAATIVGWLSYTLIEQPGVRLQKLVGELRNRRDRTAPRRLGPRPRWLPDVVLATAEGVAVPLRELPRDRPLLMAFDRDGGHRLEEQRFRLDAHEADGFYVTTDDGLSTGPAGTTVLVDRDDELSRALNGHASLLEVSPAGLITAVHDGPATAIKELV